MPQNIETSQLDAALKAVFLLIGDEKLQDKLQDQRQAGATLDRLGLPQDTRPALLDIVNKLSSRRANRGDTNPEPAAATSSLTDVQRILLESFVHIRWSFWISIIMSVILFLMGLVFLAAALMQSLNAQSVSSSTLTIAGLGIADFVLIFYTRPWKDVTTNLANAQQIRMIATSYLAGFALIRGGTQEQRKALDELTERSVGLVQKFVEDDTGDPESSMISNSKDT